MCNKEHADMLYRIAYAYYEKGLTQNAIARQEHVSRPHISRLLKEAKEKGIVIIEIKQPSYVDSDNIKNLFKKLTGIEYIEIADVPSVYQNKDQISTAIAEKSNKAVNEFLFDCRHVGVGEGLTVWKASKQRKGTINLKNTRFIPMIGLTESANPVMQVNSIAERMAETYGGECYFTNLPIVVDRNEMKSKLFENRYKKIKEQWDQLDGAIIGFGKPYESSEDDFILNEATAEYKEKISKSNNVGDILASFIDPDGNEIKVGDKFEKISFPLNEFLIGSKKILCLAGGTEKANGLSVAIRKKYINGLVTDKKTALKIIEIMEEKNV